MKKTKLTVILPLLNALGNKWAISCSPELREEMFCVGHNIVLCLRGQRRSHRVSRVDHDGENIVAVLKTVQLNEFPTDELRCGGWEIVDNDPLLPLV
jgi:hypothetical protein